VLDDLSDFIAPSQACVKPMQIDPKRTSLLIELEDDSGGGPSSNARQGTQAVAKVTLNDCLACSGCVTSAETVLIGQQSAGEFLTQLRTPRTVVVSISPASRASLAAHYALSSVDAFDALARAFRQLGCTHVFDCGLAADISLIESAAEFIHRFATAQAHGRVAARLPLMSSSCPGWICYAEKVHGETMLPHVSTVKSPQQVMGTLVRHGIDSVVEGHARLYHCTVMPCFDKKLEASRTDFARPDDAELRDVDCVLSSAEVVAMLAEAAIDVAAPPRRAETPSAEAQYAFFSNVDVAARTFRAAPGGSGGYCEYIFRTAARELFGVHLPDEQPLPWTEGRNADMRELKLLVDGEVKLSFACAHGFRNIQNIVRKVKSGKCSYDYVELMACPSGCLNGGGQVRPPADGRESGKQRLAVVQQLHHESAGEARLGWPRMDDERLGALFAPGALLSGGPMSDAAHAQLHTQYHAREKFSSGLNIKW
jgi:iron only hydrogenase large subunit-like protein